MNNLDFNLIANMLEAGGDERGIYTSAAVAEQVRLLREADNRDGTGVHTTRREPDPPALIRLWRQPEPDNGEDETEFDKGCEQTYNECADALERWWLSQKTNQ